MAFFEYPEGAEPDPYTIYPLSTELQCGKGIESKDDNGKGQGMWTCTRAQHGSGLHVARGGNEELCATWEDGDEGSIPTRLNPDGSPKPKAKKAAAAAAPAVIPKVTNAEDPVVPPGAQACRGKGTKKGKCGRWCCEGNDLCWQCFQDDENNEDPDFAAAYCKRCDKFDKMWREHQKKKQTSKEIQKMGEKDDVKKAEIVFSERVTFRVDDGKEIVIENEDEAKLWIERRKEEREKEVVITENLDGSFPSDGMIALARVLRKEYGFMKFDAPTPWGVPVVLNIPAGAHGEMVEAPWGKFQIPGMSGFLVTSINKDKNGQPVFQLAAKVKNKDKDKVKKLATLVREDLKRNSIYRGKAIKVEFPDFRRVAFDPAVHVPSFLDVTSASPEKLIFSREVQNAVELSIFTPILHAVRVKREVGTLKRGVLLGGAPGTGKTLAAYVTANLCERNGWTFIYLASTGDLAQAIHFAKMYQPAVIFAEDLDSIVNTYAEDGDRDEATMAVLNTLDGIDSKASDIMVVFTTNYPEKLPEAMIRPGRLDAVITVLPPDSEAVEKLIRLYSNGLLREHEDLRKVSESLAGNIPAVIKEVVDRSKLAAIRHTAPGEDLEITSEDLLMARDSMISHLKMLTEKREPPPSDIEKAANVVVRYVTEAMKSAVQGNHLLDEEPDSEDMERKVDANPVVKRVAASLQLPPKS